MRHSCRYPPPDGLGDDDSLRLELVEDEALSESDGDDDSLRLELRDPDALADPLRLSLSDPDLLAELLMLSLVEGETEVLRLALSDDETLTLVEDDRELLVLELVEDDWLTLVDGDSEGNETHIAAARRYRTVPSSKVTGIIRISPEGTEKPVATPAAAPASRLRSASEALRLGPPTEVGVQAMRDLLSEGRGADDHASHQPPITH